VGRQQSARGVLRGALGVDENQLALGFKAGGAGQQQAEFVGLEFALVQHGLHGEEQGQAQVQFDVHVLHAALYHRRQQHAGKGQRLAFVFEDAVRHFVRQHEGQGVIAQPTFVDEELGHHHLTARQGHGVDLLQPNHREEPGQCRCVRRLLPRFEQQAPIDAVDAVAVPLAADLAGLGRPVKQALHGGERGCFHFARRPAQAAGFIGEFQRRGGRGRRHDQGKHEHTQELVHDQDLLRCSLRGAPRP
jgi:hypothetical protein